MSEGPRLIVQAPRGGAVDRQLDTQPPRAVTRGEVVVESLPADQGGGIEAPEPGEVVLSVPSPETLAREADEVHRVIAGASAGVEPLIVEVGAAEELREDELDSVLEASNHTSRPVILRIVRDA